MYRKLLTLLFCVFFTLTSKSQNCGISVVPDITVSCEGISTVTVSVGSSNIADLNNANYYIILPSSTNPVLITDFFVNDNDVTVIIPSSLTSEIGEYTFSVSTVNSESGSCFIPDVNFSILEQAELTLDYVISNPQCPSADGFFSGSLDGPSGIYNIYFDGELTLETSLGINEINFEIPFSIPTPSSHTIAISNFSNLQAGDQIGIFFNSNDGFVCSGLTTLSNTDVSSPTFAIAAWGDDPSTNSVQDGFQEGDEFVFLVKKTDGTVYDVDLSYAPAGTMTATNTSDFDENGISVITSFNVSDPFAESFDINLSPGTYLLEIFNSSGCLVFEDSGVEISEPSEVSILADSFNSTCEFSQDGTLDFDIIGGSGEYLVSLYGPSGFAVVNTETQFFENLFPGDYFLIVTDIGCSVAYSPQTFQVSSNEFIESTLLSQNYDCVTQSFSNVFEVLGQNISFPVSVDVVDFFTNQVISSFTSTENLITINGLESGLYSLQISSNNGCVPSQSETFFVDDSNPLIISSSSIPSNSTIYSGFDVSCSGASDAFIDITVEGGFGNYSFQWSNGSTSEDLSNISAGSYSVIVTDQNNCSVTQDFILNEPGLLNIEAEISNFNGYGVSCNGQSDGFINLNVSEGTGVYNFEWSNGATSQSISEISAGFYSVIISDNNNCSQEFQFEITEPSPLEITSNLSSYNSYGVSASGANDGSIDISVQGGTGFYNYNWSNGEVTQDLINLTAGSYTLTLTDSNNCLVLTETFQITEPGSIDLNVSTPFQGWDFDFGFETNTSCYGANDALINLSVSGGVSPYNFSWTNQEGIIVGTDQNIDNIGAGLYYVEVTDQNSISAFLGPIEITEPSPFIVSYEYSPPSCGEDIAEFTILEINGSTDPSNEENFEDPNAENGWYYAFELYYENNFINWAFNNELPLTFQFDPTFYGDGTYTMLISHIAAGFDNPDICSQSYSFEVINNSSLEILSETTSNTSCGEENGFIEVQVDGSAPYDFILTDDNDNVVFEDLDNSSGFIQINNLSAGDYDLLVLDFGGDISCEVESSYNISSSEGLIIDQVLVESSCIETSTGSISVSVSGGNGDYTYQWFDDTNNNQIFDPLFDQIVPGGLSTVNGLSSGDYFVQIIDSSGCEIISSPIFVDNISILFATINTENSVLGVCSEDPIGSIDIEPSGGQVFPDGNYVYAWSASNGGIIPSGQVSNQDLTGLSPGDYTLTLFDASGCSPYQETFFISSLDEISVEINVVEEVICYGDEAVFEYLITGEGIFDIVINNGTEIIYEETVVNGDAGSLDFSNPDEACATNNSIAVPASMTTNLEIGDQIGLFYVDESGSYVASNIITWTEVTNSLVGCGDDALTPGVLEGFQSGDEMVFLALKPDGTIYNLSVSFQDLPGFESVYVPNGLSAISSLITTSVYTQADPTQIVITEPVNGTYTFNLSNANCVYSTEFEVVVPENPISTTLEGNQTSDFDGFSVSCNGTFNGEIFTEIIGGIEPYSFSWNGPNNFTSSDENLSFLFAGDYNLTITDALGCEFDTTFVITEPDPLQISVLNLDLPSCSSETNGSIEINIEGGVGEYSIVWLNENSEVVGLESNLTDVPYGVYTVFVTDENYDEGDALTFCSESNLTIEIPELLPLEITELITSDYGGYGVQCFGEENGFISISVVGGTPPYSYSWFNEDNEQINDTSSPNISNLPAGTYTVTVTDQNFDTAVNNIGQGCDVTQTIILTEPLELQFSDVTISDYDGFGVTCGGEQDGFIDISVSGGVGNYTFLWSNNETSEDIYNLGSDTYSVTVTDENSCSISLDFELFESEPIQISAIYSDYSGYGISCNSETDGFIDLTVSGGSGVYVFDWSNGSIDEDINNLQSGEYTVLVTDSNGCEATATYILNQPDPLVVTADITEISCFGGEGDIILNWSGGVPFPAGSPYQFIQPTGVDPDGANTAITIANSALGPNGQTGYFTEIATDLNGCSVQFEVYMTQPEEISFSYTSSDYSGFNLSCFGGSDGFIEASSQGLFPPFSYSWTGPNGFSANTSLIENLIAGEYNLVIEDNNGCQVSESILLTEPNEILITSTSSTTQFSGFGVSCNNASDGWINLSVIGGTDEYFYSWTGPNGFTSTSPGISNLEPGNYFIQITDSNNLCVAYENIFLPNPEPVNLSFSVSDINSDGESNDYNGYSVSCNGGNDGAIGVFISGGSGNYIFTLNNESNGEQIVESVLFEQDPINNLPQVFYTFENLFVGEYTVYVQDLNSCSITTEIISLIEPDEIRVDLLEVTDASCFGYNDGSFNVDIDGGLGPFSYTVSSSSGDVLIDELYTTETNISFSDVFSDNYLLTFSDFNDCVFELIIPVGSPPEILTNVSIQETSCFSNGDGAVELEVYGGVSPYSILFFNSSDSLISSSFQSEYLFIDSLFQGEYRVQVTDSISCFNDFIFEVGGPPSFEINYEIVEPTCSFSFDGSILLDVQGGLEPYTVTSPQLEEEYNTEIESIMTGLYDLTIIDFEGCQGAVTIDLGVIEDDCFEIPSGFTPNGDGFNDTWVVGGAEYLINANVQIFNRWGQRVFYSQRNQEYWDGYYHNKPLPIADYYYIIEPVNGQVITGRVTIKR